MRKTDKSIKNITIASIKRHTIKPFDFKYSKVYENTNIIGYKCINNLIEMAKNEEVICTTIISELIWSILTTRRIITLEGEGLEEHILSGLSNRDFGDFKGYSKQEYTKGLLVFDDGEIIPLFIETGRASMIMIYGIDVATRFYVSQ